MAMATLTSFSFAGGDVSPIPVPLVVEEENNGFYLGLGTSLVSVRYAIVPLSFGEALYLEQDRLGNVTLLAGYNYNKYIGVEGRYTSSFFYEQVIEMKGWSLFVKPQYPVYEDIVVYGLLGYGNIRLDGVEGYLVEVNQDSFQWGVGVSYDITDNVAVSFDYTMLANDVEGLFNNNILYVDVDALTLAVEYKF